ncbi:hypothetical protein GCM10022600_27760 [Qipengyuania pelagi]|uniref:MFS transporter n=1 Tax=Qipengyuania pelagi TaxID=994320 RepID=A0A844YBN1_9SPHN|nr:MFS transporter [Qipengyuania pelagi]
MTEILAAQDTSIGPAGGRKNADVTAWVAVAAGALGAMLATLDISIVNSALPVIQGEIGATGAEGTWIATSFLVAEIVVIPLSAWLERLKARKPVLKLQLLFNRQFASVAIMALALGMVMYGSTYVIPQFLAIISDYNAFQTGLVIFWMGVPAFLLMPVLPLMIRKVDIRIAVGTGMLLMAISCFVSTSLTAESGGAVFTESQLIRGAGMILAMMFLNQATVASVAKEDAGDASGIFNAARNLGGSFALSALASFQDQRIWHHTRRMEETLNANSVSLQTYLDGLARSLGDMERAMAALGGTLQREAFIMTYNDVFLVMGLLTLATVPLVLFLKPLPENVSLSMH